MNPAAGWDLVVSYGDLSRPSGYRTRVLGELEHLDVHSGFSPYLLLFDRNPRDFERTARLEVPYRAFTRSDIARFYSELTRLSRLAPIRMVHAHNLYSAALAISARPFHRYKIVLDYHGRIPEEFVYLGKGGRSSRKVLELLEAWTIRHSDYIVPVSHHLADYLKKTYRVASADMSVIPCCTDSKNFRWYPALRESTRERLGLVHKLVCTHLGSFFEWYDSDLLVKTFEEVLTQFGIAHLLVISAETEAARKYLAKRLPADTFTVLSATRGEVSSLLNASDLGFLLLRPSPNIRTSSPVKFAEYLSCGLPVVITPEVGDYSDYVAQTRTGWVSREDHRLDIEYILSILQSRDTIAEICTAAAKPLIWSSMQSRWKDIVSHLT